MEPLSREALAKLAKDVKDLAQNAIDGVKVGLEQESNRYSGACETWEAGACTCRDVWHRRLLVWSQVVVSDDNLADIQAEYDGPGKPRQGCAVL
jgi:hypothetical protein